MAVRVDNKLRLGGIYQVASRDPEALVKFCRKEGFSAAYDPGVEDRVQLEEIKAAFAQNDIVIAETGAYSINILEPDQSTRERNIAEICRRLERAEAVGSLCCVAHGGSVASGRWGAHNPANFSQESIDTTVKVIQRIVDTVRPEITRLCLETESRCLPDSPDVYVELIKAVDRPQFQAHLDPINITSNPRRFYFSGDFIRDCFEKLGPYILSCHAKDIEMVSRSAQVHFHETFAGNGGIDFRTYIAELVKTRNDAPMMIEHFPGRQQVWARDFISEQAAAVGVTIRNAELREVR
jgi:sugar phosphate isomerase/epimerase